MAENAQRRRADLLVANGRNGVRFRPSIPIARSPRTALARTPVPPEEACLGALSAQLRRSRPPSAMSPSRRFETSLKSLKCATSGHSRMLRRAERARRGTLIAMALIPLSTHTFARHPSAAFARIMPKKPIAGMTCERCSRHLRSVASAARIKSASPTSAMRCVDGSNRAAAPASSRPAVRKRQPLG